MVYLKPSSCSESNILAGLQPRRERERKRETMEGVSSSLNPEAPEFFPASHYYYNPPPKAIQVYTSSLPFSPYHDLPPSSIVSPPNPNPSLHFTTSILQPSPCTGGCVVLQSHNLLQSAAAMDEPPTHLRVQDVVQPAETVVIAERTGRRGVKGTGGYKKLLFGRRGYVRSSANPDRQQARESCNGNKRLYYCCPRNVKCSGTQPSTKQRHPLLPLEPNGPNTTVMIRNIPNRYTRELLMEFLDTHCMVENEMARLENSDNYSIVSAYDFLYLPIDFYRKANKGYAFVNFTDARAAWKFYMATSNQNWDLFQSNKIREIVSARIQGKEALERRFASSSFDCESEEYLPVCFSPPRDGSRAAVNQRTIGLRP